MQKTRCVLAIDIGGTTIKAGIVDRNGGIASLRSESSLVSDRRSFRRNFRSILNSLIESLPRGVRVEGAGIGCKGILEPDTSLVRILPGQFQFLEGVRLDRWVRQEIGHPLAVRSDNDAKVALLGEQRWGAARAKRDVVLLTLGSGVGGAILSGGRMLRGFSDVAGHLGHVTVDSGGPICSCGNRGCLESIFSARAIEGTALSAIRRGCETTLRSDFAERPEELTCLDVFDAASAGDAVAQALIQRAVSALAAAMAGMAHALDPELFLLGGQIAEAGKRLFAPLREEFFERTHRLVRRRIPILKAGLGKSAGVLGAAALAWSVVDSADKSAVE